MIQVPNRTNKREKSGWEESLRLLDNHGVTDGARRRCHHWSQLRDAAMELYHDSGPGSPDLGGDENENHSMPPPILIPFITPIVGPIVVAMLDVCPTWTSLGGIGGVLPRMHAVVPAVR